MARRRKELNASKSKILVVVSKRGKKHEELEEVMEFKYPDFTFKENNREEAHIKNVTRRTAAAMAQIWYRRKSLETSQEE